MLGGQDFTKNLYEFCVKDVKTRLGVTLAPQSRGAVRLRAACERAKCALSNATSTMIEVENAAAGATYKTVITRAKFEELNAELFKSTITIVEQTLKAIKVGGRILKKDAVDVVIMVGGSSRIPKVIKLLSEFFGKVRALVARLLLRAARAL